MGYEEDENKNYIPDRFERIFNKDLGKKDKNKSKNNK